MESIQRIGGSCRTTFPGSREFDCVGGTTAGNGFMGVDFCDGGGLCTEEHEFCSYEGGNGVGVLKTVTL